MIYTVGPWRLFIIHITVYIRESQILIYPSPSPLSPFVIMSLFSVSVSLLTFCKKKLHLQHFLESTCKWYRMALVFVCLTSLGVILSRCIRVAADGTVPFFVWLINIPSYMCAHLLYPSLCRRSCRLLPCLAHHK